MHTRICIGEKEFWVGMGCSVEPSVAGRTKRFTLFNEVLVDRLDKPLCYTHQNNTFYTLPFIATSPI